jgi:hypothetical protein
MDDIASKVFVVFDNDEETNIRLLEMSSPFWNSTRIQSKSQ